MPHRPWTSHPLWMPWTSTPIHRRLISAPRRLLDPSLLRKASTLRHPRSPTTLALANSLLMACPRAAVLAEEVVPIRHLPSPTLRPSQGPTASTLLLSPPAVLALGLRRKSAGRAGATMIQTMMMRNLTLDPQLLELVTLFHAIRKKSHFFIRLWFNYLYPGDARPFASSASSQSNDDATNSGKVMHVSRKPSLHPTRRPAKCISLIEVCRSPHTNVITD